ncbi:MAG TPA: PA domain-containing protein [Pyrinomonadaceae bacterium]|nr:PA domain-containing protein [Pyrinomonadaceae bacterium]
MKKRPLRVPLTLIALKAVLFLSFISAEGSATIVVQNNDGPGVGFNDPTPVAPVGNNSGTTLGQQRLNAFRYAANIWGAILNSDATIVVRATWEPLTCTSTTAVLGSAGSDDIFRNFAGAQFTNTWYSAALANALAGGDLDADHEINARFNINLGTPGCLDNSPFYLGLDNNHGNAVDLVAVLLHEFSHGLGFQTFTSSSTGVQNSGSPSVYDRFLFDNTVQKTWSQMTDVERQASAVNTGNLAWSGPRVTADVPNVLASPSLQVGQPGAIAQVFEVGTAAFGPPLTTAGVGAILVQALDAADGVGPSTTDGCSALTNAGAVSGKIALIDRGDCLFVEKVKNAQNAGAVGVVIANNVANPAIIQLGGSDVSIMIPSVMVSQADGNTIRSQLGLGLLARMLLDPTLSVGTDSQHRALIFAPNPIQSGSSISHWDTSLFPSQLMEPNISGDLTHSVVPIWDLSFSLLRDVGWSGNAIGDSRFFVRQHYRDFLNREPDPNGLSFWNREIAGCGIDLVCQDVKRINVSAAFFLSIEFQETGYLVYRMYKAAFGDINPPAVPVPVRFEEFLPDTVQIGLGVQVGVGNWQQQLETNKQLFASNFVLRQQFINAFSGTTNAQFVDRLNTNSGGALSSTERQTLLSALDGGTMTRAQVLRAVAEDQTLRDAEFRKAFVLMQYFGYLRRNPDSSPDTNFGGWQFWLDKLNQFNGNFVEAEMVKAFIVSIEYRQRFGS